MSSRPPFGRTSQSTHQHLGFSRHNTSTPAIPPTPGAENSSNQPTMTVSDTEMELAGPVSQGRRPLKPTSRLLRAHSDTEMDFGSEPTQPAKAHSHTDMELEREPAPAENSNLRVPGVPEFHGLFSSLPVTPTVQDPDCRFCQRTRARTRARARELRRARGPLSHEHSRARFSSDPYYRPADIQRYIARFRGRELRELAALNHLTRINSTFGQPRDQSWMYIRPDQVADGAPRESGTADVDMDVIGGSLSDLTLAQTDGPFDGEPPQGNRQH